MKVRQTLAGTLVGTVSVLGMSIGVAAAAPAKPVVSAAVGNVTAGNASISYTANRGVKQIAGVSYSLNSASPVPAPAPVGFGKNSSGGSFNVTVAGGLNTLTISVQLTDGGRAMSSPVQFDYTPSYAKAGCFEYLVEGYFLLADGTNPQYPIADTFPAYIDESCTELSATHYGGGLAMLWAGNEAEASVLCEASGGSTVVAQREPNLYACYA